MNALELLKQDHEEVKELFEQAEGTDDSKEQRNIFKQIKKALESHARIEEGIFYPAMEKHAHLKDLVLESYEEHKQIKILLKEMDALVTGSEEFEPNWQEFFRKSLSIMLRRRKRGTCFHRCASWSTI